MTMTSSPLPGSAFAWVILHSIQRQLHQLGWYVEQEKQIQGLVVLGWRECTKPEPPRALAAGGVERAAPTRLRRHVHGGRRHGRWRAASLPRRRWPLAAGRRKTSIRSCRWPSSKLIAGCAGGGTGPCCGRTSSLEDIQRSLARVMELEHSLWERCLDHLDLAEHAAHTVCAHANATGEVSTARGVALALLKSGTTLPSVGQRSDLKPRPRTIPARGPFACSSG